MPYRDYRVVVITPAGRQRYLELLIPQVLAYAPIVDEYRLWVNTGNENDIKYMKEQESKNPLVTLEFHTQKIEKFTNCSIHHFFKNTVDPNTIYIRFDDDVVLLDSIENFKAFLDFRIDHPEFFVVFGNIINNAIVSHIQQRAGNIDFSKGAAGYKCVDTIGWGDPHFAEHVHRTFIKSGLDMSKFKTCNWLLYTYERVSINTIAWLGAEFAKFDGVIDRDEEVYITMVKPKELKKMNAIFGGYNTVHFAFMPQRKHLDTTDILDIYTKYALRDT